MPLHDGHGFQAPLLPSTSSASCLPIAQISTSSLPLPPPVLAARPSTPYTVRALPAWLSHDPATYLAVSINSNDRQSNVVGIQLTLPAPPLFASSLLLHRHVARFLESASGVPNQYFSSPPLSTASLCASSSRSPRWTRSVLTRT